MKKRFVSLDVLRGITIAFMCIVNNPGTWSHVFPPLRHAAWTGCTPTDLVYPFFVFCMGCAMAFSFTKYEKVDARAYLKVLKRGALIFLVDFPSRRIHVIRAELSLVAAAQEDIRSIAEDRSIIRHRRLPSPMAEEAGQDNGSDCCTMHRIYRHPADIRKGSWSFHP